MNNHEIAAALNMIGTLLEILDDNSFRSNAYYNAGRKIEGFSKPIALSDLDHMAGVGPALREKISDMLTKGYSPYLEKLRAEIPPGLLEVLRIPSLGPKRVRTLWRELGVTSLDELESACSQGRLKTMKGFGEKLQDKIVRGLQHLKEFSDRFLLGEAVPIARDLLRELCRAFHVKQFAVAGSVRRGCELVRNLDIVTTQDDLPALLSFLQKSNLATQLTQIDSRTLAARLTNGLPLRITSAFPEQFGASLVYFTGSRSHGDRLMAIAASKGLDFSSRGLFKGTTPIAASSEAQVYEALGLAFIEPELRENSGELEATTLPTLISRQDLVGTVHAHTTWSDGVNTLEEMVEHARSLGFKYLGISDHSKSAAYAGGLTVDRVYQQAKEIAQLQTRYPDMRILHGTECDILADGGLDYPDEVLAKLDFVVGSIHSQFAMSEAEMTRRVIRAIEHPLLDILGHPTGRLLLGREGFKIDLDQVLDAVKRNGKVIEINANPHRLDLDTTWIRAAREKGVIMSIDPDAHNRLALADVDYGVTLARRGWVSRETILNAERPEKALDYFRRNR